MAYENLLWDVRDAVGIVTFNRPKVLNAISAGVLDDLDAVLQVVERDRELRALVLTGAGEKAFVAGADIAAMSAMSPAEARAFAERAHRLLERLELLPIPTIAAVNGFALGGGCEIALACDLVYAGENARFGQPEVNLGIIPGFGGTQRLTRRVGRMRALEMILTGDHCAAARAKEMGLVLDVLPQAGLLDHAIAQARKIAAKGPVAVALAKRAVHAGADADLSVANELERQAFSSSFATDDAREGMRAFLEKRQPKWTGT
jgi:enoyl-CoA hydratase